MINDNIRLLWLICVLQRKIQFGHNNSDWLAYMVFAPLLMEVNYPFSKDEHGGWWLDSSKCQWSWWTHRVAIGTLFFV